MEKIKICFKCGERIKDERISIESIRDEKGRDNQGLKRFIKRKRDDYKPIIEGVNLGFLHNKCDEELRKEYNNLIWK
jgi:hypothetical protein